MTSDPPAEAPVERRLATILVADVYGYSRMMGENEERTVRILRAHRAIFDEMLKTHRGRIFNTAGDAVLAEFPSAVDAVRCATEIQSAIRTRNEALPESERMWFRIGINLGDVVVQGGDLLGDGVNVAARIQTAAEPGGVCISGSVYDQIQNKLTLSIRQLGERTYKNIARPVRTFAITDAEQPGAGVSATSRRRIAAIAAVVVVCGAIAAGGWWLYRDSAQREAAAAKLAAELKAAKDALAESEGAKRKAEQDKADFEAAQREAALQSELRAAKQALAKQAKPETPKPAVAAAAPPPPAIDRFDGVYKGRLCKVLREASLRCFPVVLTAHNGTLAASWSNRVTHNAAQASGSIRADGNVTLEINSFDSKGEPLAGKLTGRWVDKTITLAGTWSDGTAGNATLAWAPDAPSTPTSSRRKSN
jgi:adenylate cyclase